MASKKEEIRETTKNLHVAKGLSRAQAERAAAAAARNVNAYGQKEEGPSRWQERKEAKREMYLRSTERGATIGVKRDSRAGEGTQKCQRCLKVGHWTYECKNEPVYTVRPSRTQQLKNPKLQQGFADPADQPPETRAVERERLRQEVMEKFEKKTQKREKRKRTIPSSSSEDSTESDETSTSSSSRASSSVSESGSSDSEEETSSERSERRGGGKRRGGRKRRSRRNSSSTSSYSSDGSDSDRTSSEDSESDSETDSGSDTSSEGGGEGRNRKKGRKNGSRDSDKGRRRKRRK